jgi:hypothetical protein
MAKLFAKKVPKKCSMNSKSAQIATIPTEISPKTGGVPVIHKKVQGMVL